MNSRNYRLATSPITASLLAGIIGGLSIMMLSTTAFSATTSESTNIVANPLAGQKKSTTCQGCHGTDGNSYANNWPNLAAQHASYIEKQIGDFQSGKRKDPTMSSMVGELSEQDTVDIAAYFSQQSLVTNTSAKLDVALIALGKKIYKGGNVYSGVPACSSCHGPNGAGIQSANFPVLAGQKIDYVKKTLQDFRTKTRSNDPRSIMQNVAASLTDNEIKSVASYIYTLPEDAKPSSKK